MRQVRAAGDHATSPSRALVRVLPRYVAEPELSLYAGYPRRGFVSPRVSGFLAQLEAHIKE